ncbi:hypothetical protein CYY_000242 [Polysphondylium violaceum]|uniref:FNIP repeat-containing protein n=1 Tax=Polysphondylium violaceum TaxID=133409 RepID=A0A8J4Q541_9MYCE|nr:hypothetical protein CYY_000242 [Polysphondylium violaceum]
MIDISFYLIWRNNFIRGLIRGKVLECIYIKVDLEYLNSNHQYLSLLSPLLKLNHRISVCLDVFNREQLVQYQNNKHKHLINYLCLDIGIHQRQRLGPIGSSDYDNDGDSGDGDVIDFDSLGRDIHTLVVYVDKSLRGVGKLPDSIYRLTFNIRRGYESVRCQFIDIILTDLPVSLKQLSLPNNYTVHVPVAIPDTLVKLYYCSTLGNLKQFVVSPCKTFDDCRLQVLSIDDLQWVNNQTWITSIEISGLDNQVFRPNTIAPHICWIQAKGQGHIFNVGSLPSGLKYLYLNCTDQLAKGTLPSSLKDLEIKRYNNPLELDILPPSLVNLSFDHYIHPIAPSVLPNSLAVLRLNTFNLPLPEGLLPNSLSELWMEIYSHPLTKGVLPPNLKVLALFTFNSTIAHGSLPNSLTNVQLPCYSAPLDSFGVLSNIRYLSIRYLNQSTLPVISSPNTKILVLSYRHRSNVSLASTFIQHLVLVNYGPKDYIDPSFLPPTLKSITTNGTDVSDINRNVSFMIDTTFYSIWRNVYIRGLVRVNVCREARIKVDLEYLNNNQQHLSLLSNNDKLENNISVILEITTIDQLREYLDNKYNSLVNDLYISIDGEKEQSGGLDLFIDCDRFPHGITSIEINVDRNARGRGRLPDSVTKVLLGRTDIDRFFTYPFIDHVLSSLPNKLEYLGLPLHIKINAPIHLPNTIQNVSYLSSQAYLQHFVVPPNKVFNDCTLEAKTTNDLQWISNNPWVTRINIPRIEGDVVGQNLIPKHLRQLTIYSDTEFEKGCLPPSLEFLSVGSTSELVDVLPPNLTQLTLGGYQGELTRGLLPSSLKLLEIFDFDNVIHLGAMPSRLVVLSLESFNQPLQVGILPNSLVHLRLNGYNHPLVPGILPSLLNTLSIAGFDSTIAPNSFPLSLTRLDLLSYTGSLDSIGVLDQLTDLSIVNFDRSLHRVISPKTKTLRLAYQNRSSDVDLLNTLIQHLVLVNDGQYNDDYKERSFLPPTLLTLKAYRIQITNIPNGCKASVIL